MIFNAFLEKYIISTDNIYKSSFRELYEYIYNAFGDHTVNYVEDLVYDVIIPLQNLLK